MIPPNILKSRAKRGPKLSRELRVDFVLYLADAPPRRLRPETAKKIKLELMRLAGNGDRRSFKFVEAMFRDHPELREA
jgi:hypothetical protein